MSAVKCALPLLLIGSLFCATSEAALPLKTTYRIHVQYELWRGGWTYWETEFETNDSAEAQMVLSLFEAALQAGVLSEIMDCDIGVRAVDVRMTSKTELMYDYQYLLQSPVVSSATIYR